MRERGFNIIPYLSKEVSDLLCLTQIEHFTCELHIELNCTVPYVKCNFNCCLKLFLYLYVLRIAAVGKIA